MSAWRLYHKVPEAVVFLRPAREGKYLGQREDIPGPIREETLTDVDSRP